MENASKALIMAGGMLIAIIVVSIGVYLFANFGGTSKEIQEQIDSRALSEFNNNFEKYLGSTEITIHEIISLANFANKNNEDFEPSSDYYVYVYLDNKEITDMTKYSEAEYINLIKSANGNATEDIARYTCKENSGIKYCELDNGSKRVQKIYFKSN